MPQPYRPSRRPYRLRPVLVRPNAVKKPKPRKHWGQLTSRRTGLYACPTCGPLGSLQLAIVHAVENQFEVTPE